MKQTQSLLTGLLPDLLAGITMLTRLPIPVSDATRARQVNGLYWTFPVVGLILGVITGCGFWLLTQTGLSVTLSVLLAFGGSLLLTGAFHEDGLADIADGFGGGWTKEKKLEIMKDSRIGTYGTCAVVLSLVLRGAALVELQDITQIMLAFVVAAALSRSFTPLTTALLPMARVEGLGAQAGRASWSVVLITALIGTLIAMAAFGGSGFILMLAALGTHLVMAWISKKQVDGYTGDVLGAGQQLSEIAVLVTLTTL